MIKRYQRGFLRPGGIRWEGPLCCRGEDIGAARATPSSGGRAREILINGERAMKHRLVRELSHYAYLRERLVAEFPETDEETLLDTLEGLTDLHEMIAAVTRTRLDDLALTGALKSRIAEMQSRLSRIEYRAEVLKEAVVSTMERAGIRKISEADFTLTLRPTAAPLQITEEDLIPDVYWRPQPPRLDRKGLIEALKDGGAVPGAVLGNGGMTISVRTR